MSTLKELFDKHGSVWLATKSHTDSKQFKPLAYSEINPLFIIGEVFGNYTSTFYTAIDSDCFVLYEEPKPKVKRYQFVISREDSAPILLNTFYKSYDEFLLDNKLAIGRGAKYKRLDSTMQEFDW